MGLHVNVDYDEGDPTSYRGIKVTRTRTGEGISGVAFFGSDNPQQDWKDYLDWADKKSEIILGGSSISHFLWDVPGWRMIEDDRGREIIVPEDRPEIESGPD